MINKNDIDKFQSQAGYLYFEHLNFKLAVLQHLIFETKVYKPQYDFGDFYSCCDSDLYIRNALQYFEYLAVPAHFARSITELHIDAGNEIYFEIYPDWDGEDCRFDIDTISEREISQFPKLKRIGICCLASDLNRLTRQLKRHNINVFSDRSDSKKHISPVLSLLLMLIMPLIGGGLSGVLFHQKYQNVEVTSTTSTTSESSYNDTGYSSDTQDDIPQIDWNQKYEERMEEQAETLKKYLEDIENTSKETTP